MLRSTSIIGLLFTLLFINAVQAKDYKQGEDYFTLDNQVSTVQQISEYFSFYCPACFRQEPFMKALKSSLKDPSAFVKSHVTKMPGRDEATETMLSKALITARLLNIEQPITDAIFQKIHINKSQFSSSEELTALFIEQGVDETKFNSTFNSFKVKLEAKRMAANTKKLRELGYNSVPTLVINNNFIPNLKSIKTLDEYNQLIHHLLTLTK